MLKFSKNDVSRTTKNWNILEYLSFFFFFFHNGNYHEYYELGRFSVWSYENQFGCIDKLLLGSLLENMFN